MKKTEQDKSEGQMEKTKNSLENGFTSKANELKKVLSKPTDKPLLDHYVSVEEFLGELLSEPKQNNDKEIEELQLENETLKGRLASMTNDVESKVFVGGISSKNLNIRR